MSFDQGTSSWAIVLPGAGYTAQAPMLWYARRVALEAGRGVLVITDVFDRDRDDPTPWVEDRGEAALRHLRAQDPHPLLIAKSFSSLASRLAAAADLPAVWFTPLIASTETAVAEQVLSGLRAAREPRLLIGGSEDPTWDGRVALTLANAEVVELAGADHSLEVAADVSRSLEHLKAATDATRRFVADLR